MLLAVGPRLAGIQPNDGDLLPLKNIDVDSQNQIGVRDVAPPSLTLKFDENQVLDPTTLAGVRVIRSGLDGEFEQDSVAVNVGYVGVGDSPNENEIIIRFAETLPDDLYRVELSGIDDTVNGIVALRNVQGEALVGDTAERGLDADGRYKVDFELALGPQVIAVVPQPVTRVAVGGGSTATVLSQARNEIVVYFNDDDLFVEDDAAGNPTWRSAENPAFWQLIFTRETVDNTDDIVFHPSEVRYNADADTATMLFLKADGSAQNLDELTVPAGYPDAGDQLGPGTFRLRIGTNEETPPPPTRATPQALASEDFNTGGAVAGGVDMTFTARSDLARSVNVSITKGNLAPSAPPTVAVTGNLVEIVLNENGPSTAEELRLAVAGNSAANLLLEVTIAGDAGADITGPADATTDLRVVGLGSSYDTATDLGLDLAVTGTGDDFRSGQTLTVVDRSGRSVVFTFGGTGLAGIAFAGATRSQLIANIVAAVNGVSDFGAQATAQGDHIRFTGVQRVGVDPTITGLSTSSSYLLISSSIDPQEAVLDYPGSPDEPGHRELPGEMSADRYVNPAFGADRVAGVATILYNFKLAYGFDANGDPLSNAITENQKQRVREAVELWARYLGVQFLETADQGLTFVTGDVAALNPADSAVVNESTAGFRVRVDPTYQNGMLIVAPNPQWSDAFGGEWFLRAMVGLGFMLGLQRSNDLPVTNLMSFDATEPFQGGLDNFFARIPNNTPPEPIFPGNADVIHGQYIHRTDSNDIDLYRFTIDLQDQTLDEPKTGLLTLETFAERLPNSSPLNTVVSLYREVPVYDADGAVTGYERALISRNDDYYSSDSYVRLELGSGTYYIGVTASGNTSFDPIVEDTGSGGRSQGAYDLRVSFRAQVDDDDTISDQDRAGENRPGTRLDGDADGIPGGVYNFWFQTRPLQRELLITGDGTTFADGQTLVLEDGRGTVKRFEFDNNSSVPPNDPHRIDIDFDAATTAADIAESLWNEIAVLNSTGFGVSAQLGAGGTSLILFNERSSGLSYGTVGVELAGKTIFVDKTSGANLTGALQKPFDSVKTAFAAALPGDIVRFVGNGGVDGDQATIRDNFAYEVGLSQAGAAQPTLKDGATMDVPQGVTVMIDAGAIFKLRRAYIGVGSSTLTVDRSGGSLQVLGTPHLLDDEGHVLRDASGQPVAGSVYFTSLLDEAIGQDGTAGPTSPSAGDWGGISFRADLDNAESRANLEDEGIFLNYVNHADMRYGGGLLKIDSVDQIVNPILIVEMRPTITFNTITASADAAMSADPNSFEETNFHSPRYQLNRLFTSDYERVGPEIVGNHLEGNSINGLFVRIETPAASQIRTLTVPGRFDDIDIVHVLAENLMIRGEPGQAVLETLRPAVTAVTLSSLAGGSLAPGAYTYKLVFVDENGFEGRPSEATNPVMVAAGQGAVRVENLPPVTGNFVTRRLYRSPAGGGSYQFVADLNPSDTSYLDKGLVAGYALQRDPPSAWGVALTPQDTGGTLPPGTYSYRIVFADDAGHTSPASDPTADVSVDGMLGEDTVQLSNLPEATGSFTKRLLYRSAVGGAGLYTLIGELPNSAGDTFLDTGLAGTTTLDPLLLGVVRARPDARLKIDPGTVVKLEGARIEVSFGAQLIAEGFQGQEIIFTSKLDDRFGAGGTFDTNDDGLVGVDPAATAPTRGQWAGMYIGYLGQLNLDHAYVGYGGGDDSKIEGTFKGFNVIEIHQADARIANCIIEQNDYGIGGQGPNNRFGRGANERATIFVRGARPVILNNIIRDNADVAIDINADAFTNEYVSDPGRTTGPIDQTALYRDNQGPLVRGNRIANNGPSAPVPLLGFAAGEEGTNGMKVRTAGVGPGDIDPVWALTRTGITLSTESVWDDTDIVHILYDEIRVPNFQTYGGLQLKSSADESLVIKLFSPVNGTAPPSPTLAWEIGNAVNDLYNDNPTVGAGFTATGTRLEIEDRIGGAIYVLGQPGFPVIMTSIHDDTVGAGLQPNGQPQTDTNNDGNNSEPEEGDWRSVRLDQNSHDRNVEIILEQESPTATAPGINASVEVAQFVGELAANETEGDENLRMGFVIHGFLNAANDIDVYSFTAEAGTEIWLDIDHTTSALDTVVEVLNSDGILIASSDNSLDETLAPSLLYSDPLEISATSVRPLQKLATQYQPVHVSGLLKDHWSTNVRDAGLRILLPGVAGTRSPYTFRVRSSNLSALEDSAHLQDPAQVGEGLTSGVYQLQLRLRETDEVPGSTVRYADIRYAQNGVEVIGLPGHSPLLGEASEDEGTDSTARDTASNDSITVDAAVPGRRPQDLGNLFETDRAVLSIAGALDASGDVDFYQFAVDYQAVTSSDPRHTALTFDLDYADGIGRPNTTVTVFQQIGDVVRPVLIGRDSNVADDRSEPAATRDADDPSGVWDLSRGSVGSYDPFIGTVAMPEGNYYVAVTSAAQTPTALDSNVYPQVRLEPIDSLVRIAEDHIGSYGGSTAQDPLVPVLLDPAFSGTGTNLWHMSTRESATTGHGLAPAFDGSRLAALGGTVGFVGEIEPNNSLGTAQSVENETWSLNANGNISFATSWPHMTVSATGNDTVDYYSFVVPTTYSSVLLDIDSSSTDTALVLFDSAFTAIDSNEDGGADPGSTATPFDPLILNTLAAGTYYIGVGAAGYSPTNLNVPVPPGQSYTLHISVQNHLVGSTTGTGGPTFYFGNEATGNYDLGTGNIAGGDLRSNAFSLQDYSAADKPTLYFNYRLDADAGDHFRVYIQRPDGTQQLVASSASSEVTSTVMRLSNDNTWRQARVELDAFAGLDGLRIRYNFSAADDNPGFFRAGVHVDDVIIGFAERGEMITNAPTDVTTFQAVSGASGVLSGAYQLEIRRSESYGTSEDVYGRVGGFLQNQLTLNRSFDTNDRLIQETTLVAPPGNELADGDSFRLGDGANVVTFEFDRFGDPNYGRVSPGAVRVPFKSTDPDYVIAAAIRDAINSGTVQVVLRLQATLSDGTDSGTAGRSNKVALFGNASGDILIPSTAVPVADGTAPDLGTADDGNALRAALLGVGVEPVGQADVIGSAASAGLFRGGSAVFGIDSGIVLATGDIAALAGPNLNDRSSGVASGLPDTDLDTALATTTTDAAALTFQFSLATAGTLYFDYVFASEEYNDAAAPTDAFAILVMPEGSSTWVNYALVPGTGVPVSTATVNPTSNSGYYHNNDPSEAGEFLREFGYDGFSDVFQVAIPLPAGIHAVKFAVADVGDTAGDTAVLIRQASFSTVASVEPRGLVGIFHEGHGDENAFRDQGQTLIHSNTILHAADYGILADAGDRDITDASDAGGPVRLQQTHMGSVRNLRELNDLNTTGVQGGFAPGAVIANNTISGEGVGGIHFSGDLPVMELTIERSARYPQYVAEYTAGDAIADGDWFSVTVGRITVEFEFDDISRVGDKTRETRRPPQSGGSDPGIEPGRVPVYYMRTSAARIGYSEWEMAEAIKSAIDNSILVTNGTTQVARTYIYGSRSYGFSATGGGTTPVYGTTTSRNGDWAVYIEGAREVQVFGVDQVSRVFENVRAVAHARAAQPFGRIVNNTIHGYDGNESSFPDDPNAEQNDTIFNAVDTRQGRAASPEAYTATAQIGDNPNLGQAPEDLSQDVDFYQYQLDIGDHVQIAVTGTQFTPELRVFNAIGQELERNGAGAPYGAPRYTVTGTTVNIDFYAEVGDTYYVAVSGPGNTAYSSLSLGSRTPATATGTYTISVNVLAPRTWVIDTRTLVGNATTLTIYDVAGNSRTITTPGSTDTPTLANSLRGQLHRILPGIRATEYGGLNPETGSFDYVWWYPRTVYERFVVVEGASKITGGDALMNGLWPILNTNNDDGLLPETGILISDHATPTLLNNVISNTRNAVVQTLNQPDPLQRSGGWYGRFTQAGRGASSSDQYTYNTNPLYNDYDLSPAVAVVGAELFQHNWFRNLQTGTMQTGNWGLSDVGVERSVPGTTVRLLTEQIVAQPDNQDFNISLANDQPLFVNSADGNFFPAPLARSIDSAVSTLGERPKFHSVKAPMGISDSPILAPTRDASGQLRIDDPDVAPPQGQGQTVFIDRGSLDRSDFVGPLAILVKPQDNDTTGLDRDPANTVVHLSEGVYSAFSIQLLDGFETADPFPGVGVNDDTVVGPDGTDGRLPGAAVTVFQNGVFLEEDIDYAYRYDRVSNTVHLIPTSGIWPDDKVYVVNLNNRDRFVINAPAADPQLDRQQFWIIDAQGTTGTFQYDSGFTLQVPQSLTIQVPAAGAALGGITDGQRFTLRDASDPENPPVVFEFDLNDATLAGSVPVKVASNATADQVAQALVAVLNAAGLGLSARTLGGGQVHVGAPANFVLDTALSQLTQAETILTLAVPAVSGDPTAPNVADGQTFTISDGSVTRTFEFDAGVAPAPVAGNVRVDIRTALTVDAVADQITSAVQGAGLALNNVQHAGNGLLYLHTGAGADVVTGTSRLLTGYVSRPLTDGETFTVRFDHDGDRATPTVDQTFEFDSDSSSSPGNVVIPFTLADSADDLATRIGEYVASVDALKLETAKGIGGGIVYLGGTKAYTLELSANSSLAVPTTPDYESSSSLVLPGPLTINVPANGGAGITRGQYFVVNDVDAGGLPVSAIFEFSDGIRPTQQPGSLPIVFSASETATDVANNICTAIRDAGVFRVGLNPQPVLNGTVVGVELTDANTYTSIDLSGSTGTLSRSGGRIADGDLFRISYSGLVATFEFDHNSSYVRTNNVVSFTPTSTTDEIAAALVGAIRSVTALGLDGATYVGGGVVELNDTSAHKVEVDVGAPDLSASDDTLKKSGIPGGAIAVPFEPWSGFSGEQFAASLITAINSSTGLDGVTALARGGNSVFVDFAAPGNLPADFTSGPARITGVSNYFLRAIQDLPGNWLKANQPNGETRFTIIMPGAALDFGDAPDAAVTPRYPTLFDNNGARHVIADTGLFLGSRVDGNRDGLPNPPALGDDLDHVIDPGSSPLQITGVVPFTIQVPPTGVVDKQRFTITPQGLSPVVFEFFNTTIPDNALAPGADVAVSFTPADTAEQIANAIIAAVSSANVGLTPAYVGAGQVYVGGTSLHHVSVAGTDLRTAGVPVNLLYAVAGRNITDGQRIRIDDGTNLPVWFEFDSDGNWTLGTWRVPYAATDTAAAVAHSLLWEIDDQDATNLHISAKEAGVLDASFVLTDLGDGVLHVAGLPSHALDLGTSKLTYSGYTPAIVDTRAAGLGLHLSTLVLEVADVAGGGVADGQTFVIDDRIHPAVTFEFVADGPSAAGNRPIAFTPSDSGAAVAAAIRQAINQAVNAGLLTDVAASALPGGLEIALSVPADHRVDVSSSGLVLTGTAAIVVANANGGGLADGDVFTIDDGTHASVTFEFDGDNKYDPLHRRITWSQFRSGESLAMAIKNAIDSAVAARLLSGIVTRIDPATPRQVDLAYSADHRLNTVDSGLSQLGPVSAGKTFDVEDGDGGGLPVRFEFTQDGTVSGDNLPILFQNSDSANDIANSIVAAVKQAMTGGLLSTDLTPQNFGGGNIQIGSAGAAAEISNITAVHLSRHGQAGGVLDGQTFTLVDGVSTRRFEFDADGRATRGTIVIAYTGDDTAAEIAARILGAARSSGFNLDLVDMGGGRMRFEGQDEDGIRFDDLLTPGATVPLTVTASASGYLDAWIDYNGDGDFVDQYEQVFASRVLGAGSNALSLTVPTTVTGGTRYARFRFSSAGGLAPTGLAVDGEVEDYAVTIYTNDPPVLVVPGQPGQPAPPTIDEDVPTPITGISVSDADAADKVIEVTLTVLNGTLLVNSAVPGGLAAGDISGNESAAVTLAGTPGQISTTLADAHGLVYTSLLHFNGEELLSVVADDLGNAGTGGPRRDYETIPLTVQPVNDAPVLNLPTALNTTEDSPTTYVPLPADAVTDADAAELPGDGTLTVTLSATSGVLTVRTDVAGGLEPADFTGGVSSAASVQFTASAVKINATLSDATGLHYQPNLDFNGTDWIVVTANDRGNTDGATGTPSTMPLESTAAIEVTVAAENDAPAVGLPTVPQATTEDAELPLRNFTISDVDAGPSDNLTVTLTIRGRNDGLTPNGIVTIKAVTGGIDLATQVFDNGTDTVTIHAPNGALAATLASLNGWSYTPPSNFGGNPASPAYEVLTIVADDNGATGSGGVQTTTRSVTIAVNQVNDPPAITLAQTTVSISEDVAVDIGPIAVSDVDFDSGFEQVTLTVTHGTITVTAGVFGGVPANPIPDNGTSQIVLQGTPNQISATLGTLDSYLTYKGNLNFNGTDYLTIVADDLGHSGGPAARSSATVTINVQAVNDPPVLSVPGNLSVNEGSSLRVPAISIADPEIAAGAGDGTVTLGLQLTTLPFAAQAGALTVNPAWTLPPYSLTVTDNGTSHVTVAGRLTTVNAMLADATGLVYYNGPDANGPVLLTVTASDNGNFPAAAEAGTQSLTITVVPVNDAPVIGVPTGIQAATEDLPLRIYGASGVSLDDVDIAETTSTGSGTGRATMTLSALHGTLDVDASGTSVTVTNDVSSFVTLNGPLDEIDVVLWTGITYQGLPHYNGSDTITLMANDLGNWPGPARITTATIGINVAAVNNPPDISVPAGLQTLTEDTPQYLPPIAISDVDVSDVGTLSPPVSMRGKLVVDLTVAKGTLALDLTVANGLRGTGGEVLPITGGLRITSTPDKINATLGAPTGLRYLPSQDANGADALTIVARDQGNYPPPEQATTAAVALNIVAVNDAPVLTLPAQAPLTNEDNAVVVQFPANAVHDVDAADLLGDGLLTVTLTATAGVLTLSGSGVDVTGASVQYTGTEAEINALLSNATGVTYTPNANFNGADRIVVKANDHGNTGAVAGTPLETTRTIPVTVNAVNDPPTLQAPAGPLAVKEDEPLILSGSVFQVDDVDAHEGTGQIRVDLGVFQGTVTVSTNVADGLGAGNVQGNGTNNVALIGTPEQINATFDAGGVVYQGVLNYNGPDTLDVLVTDRIGSVINHGSGNAGLVVQQIPISIEAVNDAPAVTIAADGPVVEDIPVSLAFTVDDVEISDDSVIWTVTLQSDDGLFTVATVPGGVSVITDNGKELVTLEGTGREVQTTLQTAGAVVFQGIENFAGPGSATITIVDPGAAGTAGTTSVATLTFTATAINDAPEVTLPPNLVVEEDEPLILGEASRIIVRDVDSGAGVIVVTLQVSHGTLTVAPTAPGLEGNGSGMVVLRGTESLIGQTLASAYGVIYQPDPNYNGVDTLVVTADDRGYTGAGGALATMAAEAITVLAVKDAPSVAHPIADIVVDEGAPSIVIELFPGVFEDPDTPAVELEFEVTDNEDATLVAASISGTKLTLDFLPYQGNRGTTIKVTASDGTGTATDEFDVWVNGVSTAPFVANPILDLSVKKGTATIDVPLANVFDDHDSQPNDPDGDLLDLKATGNSNPALVSAQVMGDVLQLTFNTALHGRADLTVTATDRTLRSVSDTFTVFVSVPPTARDDGPPMTDTFEDTAVEIPVFANDYDEDGTVDRKTVTIFKEPDHGSVAVNATTGVVTYTPEANYYNYDPVKGAYVLEPDTFTYTIKDNSGFPSNEATVTVTVKGVPDYQNPVLNADVNRSGVVSPIDPLIVINYLNRPLAPGEVREDLPADPEPPALPEAYLDVDGNGMCTSLDVLIVINYLNTQDQAAAAEGESTVATPVLVAVPDDSVWRTTTAPPSAGGAAAQAGPTAPSVVAPADAAGRKDSAFAAIGADTAQLMDLGLGEVLSAIADDVDDAREDALAEDWVLSGLRPVL